MVDHNSSPCVAKVGVGVRFAGQGLFPTCFRRLFFDPFRVVGSGQAFFRPFWDSPLSDVWVPT